MYHAVLTAFRQLDMADKKWLEGLVVPLGYVATATAAAGQVQPVTTRDVVLDIIGRTQPVQQQEQQEQQLVPMLQPPALAYEPVIGSLDTVFNCSTLLLPWSRARYLVRSEEMIRLVWSYIRDSQIRPE